MFGSRTVSPVSVAPKIAAYGAPMSYGGSAYGGSAATSAAAGYPMRTIAAAPAPALPSPRFESRIGTPIISGSPMSIRAMPQQQPTSYITAEPQIRVQPAVQYDGLTAMVMQEQQRGVDLE